MIVLLVRYEVKFQNGQECGGAYVKLLTKDTMPAMVRTLTSDFYDFHNFGC